METTLKIEGMTCGHCVRSVRSALEGVPGTTVQDVNTAEARVQFESDAAREAAVRA
jgi:copper chaperone